MAIRSRRCGARGVVVALPVVAADRGCPLRAALAAGCPRAWLLLALLALVIFATNLAVQHGLVRSGANRPSCCCCRSWWSPRSPRTSWRWRRCAGISGLGGAMIVAATLLSGRLAEGRGQNQPVRRSIRVRAATPRSRLPSRAGAGGDPARLAMLGHDGREDPAAHVEARGQAHEARRGRRRKIVEDAVGHRFVEGALVAVRPDVELQALQLDAATVRNVVEQQRGEVRLARLRTETGELRDLHVNAGSRAPGCGLGKVSQPVGLSAHCHRR